MHDTCEVILRMTEQSQTQAPTGGSRVVVERGLDHGPARKLPPVGPLSIFW